MNEQAPGGSEKAPQSRVPPDRHLTVQEPLTVPSKGNNGSCFEGLKFLGRDFKEFQGFPEIGIRTFFRRVKILKEKILKVKM